MLRKTLSALCLALQLSGCEAVMFVNVVASYAMRPELTLLPEALPATKIGVPHNVLLEVINTSSPVRGIYVREVQNPPKGLKTERQERDSRGLITGTPVKTGTYEVHISAGTYGAQCTGINASRIYTLEVAE